MHKYNLKIAIFTNKIHTYFLLETQLLRFLCCLLLLSADCSFSCCYLKPPLRCYKWRSTYWISPSAQGTSWYKLKRTILHSVWSMLFMSKNSSFTWIFGAKIQASIRIFQYFCLFNEIWIFGGKIVITFIFGQN